MVVTSAESPLVLEPFDRLAADHELAIRELEQIERQYELAWKR